MKLKANIYGRVFSFRSVAEVLAKANEVKSGDTLVGIGATSQTERVAAKLVLSRLTLEDIYENIVKTGMILYSSFIFRCNLI